MKNSILMILGWFFILLGVVGVVLPILPTTPFLILALSLFAKSSPKFHAMLLNNSWFGASLKQWEEKKTVQRKTKLRAISLVILSFAVSIMIVHERLELQMLLIAIAAILLVFVFRIKEDQ